MLELLRATPIIAMEADIEACRIVLYENLEMCGDHGRNSPTCNRIKALSTVFAVYGLVWPRGTQVYHLVSLRNM